MTASTDTKILTVEKIYLTRNYKGAGRAKPSKVAGLVVNSDIYWLEIAVQAADELTRSFQHLNIALNSLNDWGMTDRYGHASPDKKITAISKPPLDVFDGNSSYVQNAVFTDTGSLFWSVAKLRAKFPDTPWWYPDN